LFCRRGLELHGPSGARIRIASPLLAVRDRVARFRRATIRILQVFPADAGLGSRRTLSVSSAAALYACHVGSSALITIVRCLLSNSHPDSYPSLTYPKAASTTAPMMPDHVGPMRFRLFASSHSSRHGSGRPLDLGPIGDPLVTLRLRGRGPAQRRPHWNVTVLLPSGLTTMLDVIGCEPYSWQ